MDHVPIQVQEIINKRHDVPTPTQPITTQQLQSTTGHVLLRFHDVPTPTQPTTTQQLQSIMELVSCHSEQELLLVDV